MTTHPIPNHGYDPYQDEDWGKRGGLTQPAREIPPSSTLEYIGAVAQNLPDCDKVIARLKWKAARTERSGHNA